MLNDTIALGTSGTLLTFVKRFPDALKSLFSVVGLTSNAARTMTVSHQPAGDASVRSMISLDETDVDPSSSAGATKQTRLYLVLQRPSTKSATDCKAMFARLKTLVDDTAFQDKFLNQEV